MRFAYTISITISIGVTVCAIQIKPLPKSPLSDNNIV
ncbi:hypothetical protein [Enterocloster phage PMBT24]|uniref:Lipoprotein n=1 Tax=Enterocloster phage PMBT24 TaxID=3025413 RepID=A0AAT9TS15_9CAUD|nr:hypothetical protein [Enterocloster phage PMBT24]